MSQNTPTALTETVKPIAYAYSRFSTIQQADGDSKRRQQQNAQSWAEKNGYQIQYLHDAGVSAYKGKNRTIGQFGAFIADLSAKRLGNAPVLLVENLDRISRQEIEIAQALFLEVISKGAVIVTLHNSKRYERGMGLVDIITALVEMDVAHQHSAKLSMRVKEAVETRKKIGGIIHNRASSPSWLKLDAKRTQFQPDPERVRIVQRMFALAAKGMGSEAIARTLNNEAEPTWAHRKSRYPVWRGSMIASVVHGRSVLGEFEGRAGYFGPGVIPVEAWNAVNNKTRREAQGRGKGIIKESNLLCGLIKSGVDGSAMILRQSGVKSRKTGQYNWHNYLVSNLTIAGKSKHRVKYKIVESRILSLIRDLDPRMLSRAREGAHSDTSDRVADSERLVESIDKIIRKLTVLIVTDPNPSPSLVDQLKEHEAKLKIATEKLSTEKISAAKIVSVPTIPDDLSKPETRRAVRAEIAQWCQSIEVRAGVLIVWFSERHGIAVGLDDEAMVYAYDLDNEMEDRTENLIDAPEIPDLSLLEAK